MIPIYCWIVWTWCFSIFKCALYNIEELENGRDITEKKNSWTMQKVLTGTWHSFFFLNRSIFHGEHRKEWELLYCLPFMLLAIYSSEKVINYTLHLELLGYSEEGPRVLQFSCDLQVSFSPETDFLVYTSRSFRNVLYYAF